MFEIIPQHYDLWGNPFAMHFNNVIIPLRALQLIFYWLNYRVRKFKCHLQRCTKEFSYMTHYKKIYFVKQKQKNTYKYTVTVEKCFICYAWCISFCSCSHFCMYEKHTELIKMQLIIFFIFLHSVRFLCVFFLQGYLYYFCTYREKIGFCLTHRRILLTQIVL